MIAFSIHSYRPILKFDYVLYSKYTIKYSIKMEYSFKFRNVSTQIFLYKNKSFTRRLIIFTIVLKDLKKKMFIYYITLIKFNDKKDNRNGQLYKITFFSWTCIVFSLRTMIKKYIIWDILWRGFNFLNEKKK